METRVRYKWWSTVKRRLSLSRDVGAAMQNEAAEEDLSCGWRRRLVVQIHPQTDSIEVGAVGTRSGGVGGVGWLAILAQQDLTRCWVMLQVVREICYGNSWRPPSSWSPYAPPGNNSPANQGGLWEQKQATTLPVVAVLTQEQIQQDHCFGW